MVGGRATDEKLLGFRSLVVEAFVKWDGPSCLTTPRKRNADYKLCCRIEQDAMPLHLVDRNCATSVDLVQRVPSCLGIRMSVGFSSW